MVMDEGAKFVLRNYEKSIDVCVKHPEHKKHLRKIQLEYARLKTLTKTGNMLDYFDKFIKGNHRNRDEFLFLEKYNIITNEKMSKFLRCNYQSEINNRITIDDIIVGDYISTGLLMNVFGVTYRGSLRRNINKNLVVIIVKRNESHNYITDDFVIHYKATGNSFEYRTSKVVVQSLKNNTRLFLFETWGNNKYYFFGEVELTHIPEIDKNGDSYFELKRKNNNSKTILDVEGYGVPINSDVWSIKCLCKESRETALHLPPLLKNVSSSTIGRDKQVICVAKERAMGKCDLCGSTPFKTDKGIPYLECHHIIHIANGGPDRVYNVVALCPNCHRKMHYKTDKNNYESIKMRLKSYLDKEGIKDNIDAFKDLFN